MYMLLGAKVRLNDNTIIKDREKSFARLLREIC